MAPARPSAQPRAQSFAFPSDFAGYAAQPDAQPAAQPVPASLGCDTIQSPRTWTTGVTQYLALLGDSTHDIFFRHKSMLHYGTLLYTLPSFLESFSPNVSPFANIVRSGMGTHLPPRQWGPLSMVVL
ncbi:hypothetical protein N7451_012035 [Penicillium sp. IBT 35674x]|nr:hypothetical protein N7451_012035 [Penicillium sp. IBT 35674x]